MKCLTAILPRVAFLLGMTVLMLSWRSLGAVVTFSDPFGTPFNYLSNGVSGTIWDGIYLGAGDFSDGTGLGAAAGSVSLANAGQTTGGALTIASLQTDWEAAADDGFFLYKVISGNFDMAVQVVPPIDSGSYNFPGLMVRAFGTNGAPSPNNAENSIVFGRFDQFSIANMSKNNLNGVKTDTARGTFPNTNHWLRIQRVGNSFNLYEKATAAAAWTSVGSITRSDLAGLPLQAGIEHSVFSGGATRTGRFASFSITVSNLVSGVTPGAASALTATPIPGGSVQLSWNPGASSSGSVVVMWTGSSVVKQAPAAGNAYVGNATYGAGSTLPAKDHFVVYSGTGNSVVVNGLNAGQTYHAAVFAHSGSGSSRAYSHVPASTSFVADSTLVGPLTAWITIESSGVEISFNSNSGKWYRVQYTDSLEAPDWRELSPVALLATGGFMIKDDPNPGSPHRFYRVQEFDLPPAGPNVALEGTTSASYVSPWENLNAINDGYEPASSSDHSQGAYGNWPQTGMQWVEYTWPLPITTSMTDVYWWSDGGGILPPSTCRFKYWDGTNYVLVSNPSGLGVALNQFNLTTFSPVTTTRLRLEFDSGAASTGILEWRVYDAGTSPTNWPGAPESSLFAVKVNSGAITSLKRKQDAYVTEYIRGGGRLGDVTIRYRQTGTNWNSVQTASLASGGAMDAGWQSAFEYSAIYRVTNGLTPMFSVRTDFSFANDESVLWTISLTNLTAQALEIGDIAIPFPMNTSFVGPSSSVFKHSFISGHGSFLFWMRPNSVGPYLTAIPVANTSLEYWDSLAPGGGFEAFIHSKAAGATAASLGTKWRQANTSLTLPGGGAQTYGFQLQWADSYDGVRELIAQSGNLDVHVAPGMTVPTNLPTRIAIRSAASIDSVTSEFPAETQIQSLGTNGSYRIYEVRFARLGENKLTVQHGGSRETILEFFVTEPLETLIEKRAGFIAGKQVHNASKWFDGLLCEWNMRDLVQLTPENYDLISGWRIYAVTCDDPGLSKPAYLAAKNAELPVQSQVTALDYYLEYFVWGGLQRTTNETYAYGVYGIPDWYSNRNSANTGSGGQLHIWRIYDYPHVMLMYLGMYKVAKHHPQVTTALTADEYLRRAYGTALGLFTIPISVTGWSAYQTGLMNEREIVSLIDELEANGWTTEADTLRAHWMQKTKYFVNNTNADLFGSEYAFDSTGFETTHELARYALRFADPPGQTNSGIPLTNAVRFLEKQLAANLLCRGWVEPSYYYLGSDYRATAGDEYVLTYMSQMGGWGVLDYGLYTATNASPYLRLGYASYLSAWALMNTGTPESNYGYWYPGAGSDGGAGGGFEPAPYGTTWLGQAHRRGSWLYASETDLGYCGALRMAATVLADDDIFGRFCYGGDYQLNGAFMEVFPKDGLRKRFYARLNNGERDLILRNGQFSATEAMQINTNLSQIAFTVQPRNPAAHNDRLRFRTSVGGLYTLSNTVGVVSVTNVPAGQEVVLDLPIPAGAGSRRFTLTH